MEEHHLTDVDSQVECYNLSNVEDFLDATEAEEMSSLSGDSLIQFLRKLKKEGMVPTKAKKSLLYEICAANYWKPPVFECVKEEGPDHLKMFTFKTTIEIVGPSRRILECFGNPRPKKKAAEEDSAEGALWYLEQEGYFHTEPTSGEPQNPFSRKSISKVEALGNSKSGDVLPKVSEKARLFEICAMNYWKAPVFECCKEEGPSHRKLFTFKITVEIIGTSRTIFECFGNPRPNKKAAQEDAAEGAVWYLQREGYLHKSK